MNRFAVWSCRRSMFTGALLLMCVGGCNQPHPGTWTETQVEAKIQQKMSLAEIDLQPAADAGKLTGTGKNADGETFDLTVTQDVDGMRLDYEAEGDRGSIESGTFSLN